MAKARDDLPAEMLTAISRFQLPDDPAARALAARLGPGAARRRFYLESGLYGETPPAWFRRRRRFHRLFHALQGWALRLAFQHQIGLANSRTLEVVHEVFHLPGLPPELSGLRILHLSDFHADLNPGVIDRVGHLIRDLEYDLVVHTGDFLDWQPDPSPALLDAYRDLATSLGRTVYAVTGNHDPIRIVPALEERGYRFLLNESVRIQLRGTPVDLVGVDDPNFFRTDDLPRAIPGECLSGLRILLAHGPDAATKAKAEASLYLCGHTHGGQVCLPGGRPVLGNSRMPRELWSGRWQLGRLQGYTSRGAGSGQYPVRLNCPPEITVHQLVPKAGA